MADNKQSVLITDAKERVTLELYHDIRIRLYNNHTKEEQFYLELYKRYLDAVKYDWRD